MYEYARLLGRKSKKRLHPEESARLVQDFTPEEDGAETYEEPLRSSRTSIIRALADRAYGMLASIVSVRHA